MELLPFLRCVVKDGPDPNEKIVSFRTADGVTESESIDPEKIYENRLMPVEIQEKRGNFVKVLIPTKPFALRKAVLVSIAEIEYHH